MAATELFAARGFAGTSIREIAERAEANVAAGHYHYGSKQGLYLQVLREQFAQVRAALERRGATRSGRMLRSASRLELIALLGARVTTMLEILLGSPPQPHGALLLREMVDPTEALPIIVDEFIRPQMREMEAIVRRLAPGAGGTTVRAVVSSIVGQVLFYHFTRPARLLMLRRQAYPRNFPRQIARHILAFSLGGLERIVSTHAGPRAATQRNPRAPRALTQQSRRVLAQRSPRGDGGRFAAGRHA